MNRATSKKLKKKKKEREERKKIIIVLNRFCVQRGVYVCELFLIKKLAGS